jgi:hypothetical protein
LGSVLILKFLRSLDCARDFGTRLGRRVIASNSALKGKSAAFGRAL